MLIKKCWATFCLTHDGIVVGKSDRKYQDLLFDFVLLFIDFAPI
jgi:hypothetical protein